MLPPEKNLHAAVPPSLLARMEQAAKSKHVTLDQFVTEAIEHGLNRREFEDVLAFGKRHAQAQGLKPTDVAEAVAEERARDRERGH